VPIEAYRSNAAALPGIQVVVRRTSLCIQASVVGNRYF